MTKIILADDSVTIQKVVELTFADQESQVTAVSDGAAAMEKALADRPDIIISDVIMPGMNGYELCRKIKSDPSLKTVPFLFLKGTFESFDEDQARECGADGFIVKPFESQELIGKVNELIAAAAAPAPPAPTEAPAPPPVAAPAPPPVAAPPPPDDIIPFTPPKADDLTFDLGPDMAAEETAPAAESASAPGVEDDLFGMEEETLAGEPEPEEDLWSEVSLKDNTAPLIEDNVLEDESFWGTGPEDNGVAAPQESKTSSSEDLLETMGEPEILDLTEEAEAPVEVSTEMDIFAEEPEMTPPRVEESTTVAPVPEEAVVLDLEPEMVEEPAPVAVPSAPSGAAGAAVSKDDLHNVLGVRIEEAVRSILGPVINEAARKIVEEVAWDVIPDLAEAMIRSEIERIRKTG